MRIGRRSWALLALLFYVSSGLGAPLADAVITHHCDSVTSGNQVTAKYASGNWHDQHCLLKHPAAPQGPASSPIAPPPQRGEMREVAFNPAAANHHGCRPHLVLGPRAPPRSY